jgi:hypothetical protein
MDTDKIFEFAKGNVEANLQNAFKAIDDSDFNDKDALKQYASKLVNSVFNSTREGGKEPNVKEMMSKVFEDLKNMTDAS